MENRSVCGKNVTEDGWHSLSCLNLNALIKQSLLSTHNLSVLEPRHLHRTDQKRPDSLTIVPWADGKQLKCDVTIVDSLAASRISISSVCERGTAAAKAVD